MSGQGDPGGGDKNAYTLLWILAAIALFGGLIWWFFADQLKFAFIKIRLVEAQLVAIFTDKLDVFIRQMKIADPAQLNLNDVQIISSQIGQYLMYPAIGILILMALYMLKSHSHMRFHNKHNMDTLIRQEQKNWPQISPVVPLDIVDMDVNEGPWAMSQNPMQFCKKNKLLIVEKATDRKSAWRAEGVYHASLDKDKAYRALSAQMGPVWQGVDKLPPYMKALYAIFFARIEHEADPARAYLAELAQEAAKGEMHFNRTDEFLGKWGKSKGGLRCTERHAYVYTVMASLLDLARTDGVLATADFLWLKPVDRKLWYMLNTVGRQVAPSEVAGPWAHWLAEKEMHRPLSVPMIDEGVIALEKALKDIVYEADEKDDDSEFPMKTPESA